MSVGERFIKKRLRALSPITPGNDSLYAHVLQQAASNVDDGAAGLDPYESPVPALRSTPSALNCPHPHMSSYKTFGIDGMHLSKGWMAADAGVAVFGSANDRIRMNLTNFDSDFVATGYKGQRLVATGSGVMAFGGEDGRVYAVRERAGAPGQFEKTRLHPKKPGHQVTGLHMSPGGKVCATVATPDGTTGLLLPGGKVQISESTVADVQWRADGGAVAVAAGRAVYVANDTGLVNTIPLVCEALAWREQKLFGVVNNSVHMVTPELSDLAIPARGCVLLQWVAETAQMVLVLSKGVRVYDIGWRCVGHAKPYDRKFPGAKLRFVAAAADGNTKNLCIAVCIDDDPQRHDARADCVTVWELPPRRVQKRSSSAHLPIR